MSTEEIISACLKYGIENYKVNSNGTVDVFGNVVLMHLDLEEIPIVFRRVNGNFTCHNNRLTSLKGSPLIVNGYFDCSFNFLTSLEYSPTIVYGDYSCSKNKLLTLENGPYEVGGNFFCNSRDIASMSHSYYGITTNIKGKVHTDHNEEETILELFRCGLYPDQIDDFHVNVRNLYRQWAINQIIENNIENN
jgi:hypothetical protein